MTHTLRQIVVADDGVWERVSEMFEAKGIRLARIPDDEDGTQNYCLQPIRDHQGYVKPSALQPNYH